ncbi:RICIN domain-containing protein [Kribbella sp. NPDC051770]|uniref:RICIN domain-containing protein n=1 Tax=Kribbella sp. NPDC051770 TaxID=3155413 RepID=UPI0034332184
MRSTRFRRPAAVALLAVSSGALLAGQLVQTASAATFFRTIDSTSISGQQAALQLSTSSSQNNSALKFVPRFTGTAACATCGVPNTPSQLAWGQVKVVPNSTGVSLVNKATGKCADVEASAQQNPDQANGAKVVLAPCDGTLSQRWKVDLFTGNQSTFQNLLPGTTKLMLTNNNNGSNSGQAVLEPSTVNIGLSNAEKRKHIQIFGSTFVNLQ